MPLRSDAEVISSVLTGQTEAFAELVDRYQSTVCAVTVAVLNDKHAAEDAAQETFMIAYQRLVDLRDRRAFSSWLMRIARSQALRLSSKRSPAARLDEACPSAASANDVQLTEEAAALLDHVARLPEHERLVIALHHFDGHSVQAIADVTGRPVGTVTKQLSRAYQRLRDRMRSTGDEL